MKIVTAQELSRGLREMAQNVSRRLWIASPFVGGWSATKCLIDTRWERDSGVGVRLLTDIENKGWLDPTTIRAIADRGDVKHLHGLHAKIFIVDDCALVTSANLTRTAFERRTEIGVLLSDAESAPVISIFEQWWNKAEDPPNGWIDKLEASTQHHAQDGNSDEPGGAHLKKLYPLPEPPENGGGDPTRGRASSIRSGARPPLPSAAEFHSLFNKAKHFFICNTNRRHDRDAEPQMRERGYAAAWEKFKSTRRMEEVTRGDAILFYANRHGIIGVGRAKSAHEKLKRGAPDRLRRSGDTEWRIPLDWLVWADKDEDAFPRRMRTLTFENADGEQYRDLRNDVRRHFESLSGLQLTR
jgi:hypothetical protein